MSDIRDDYDEQGMTAYWLHLEGRCSNMNECEYCYEEEMEQEYNEEKY